MKCTLLLALVALTFTNATAQEVCAINLGLVVDRSGSIWIDQKPPKEQNWIDVKDFVISVVEQLEISKDDSYVGLVAFSTQPELIFPMNNLTKEQSIDAIRNLFYNQKGGKTNTTGALRTANMYLFTDEVVARPAVSNVLLLLTDGNATEGSMNEDLIDVANDIKDRNIRIITVGVTDQVSRSVLEDIASDKDDVITTDDFEDLSNELDNTINTVCATTTTSTTTTLAPVYDCSVCCDITCDNLNGERCYHDCPLPCRPNLCPDSIPIRLEDGFCGQPEDCSQDCNEECMIDLLLILDESGSVARDSMAKGGPDYWQLDMRPFVKRIIGELDIGLDTTRVGLIMYGTRARTIFSLNEITSKSAMLDKIDTIDCKCYDGGSTNTSGALWMARSMLEMPESVFGNRPNVPNVALLIADGADNVGRNLLELEAMRLRGIARLMAVGVSDQVDKERLESMLENPEEDFFEVKQFGQLSGILVELIRQTCNKCPCPEPTPIAHVYAFHAYSEMIGMRLYDMTPIVFEQTFTDYGEDYSRVTGKYTCPCTGLYYFSHEYMGVQCTLGAVIMLQSGNHARAISPLARVIGMGSLSTSALHVCRAGEQVYVRVMVDEYGEGKRVDAAFQGELVGMSKMNFMGYMVHSLETDENPEDDGMDDSDINEVGGE